MVERHRQFAGVIHHEVRVFHRFVRLAELFVHRYVGVAGVVAPGVDALAHHLLCTLDADESERRVECADEVVRERIHARSDDASDADVAVYEQFRETYDSVEDADLVVDNSGELAATFDQLDTVF